MVLPLRGSGTAQPLTKTFYFGYVIETQFPSEISSYFSQWHRRKIDRGLTGSTHKT